MTKNQAGRQIILGAVLLGAAAVAWAQTPASEDAGTRTGVAPVAAGADVARFTAPEDIVHDNGGLVTHPGAGAGGADASAVQSTTLGLSTYGFGNDVGQGHRVTDDFTVPAGETWTIDSVVFYAFQTGEPATTSPITAVNVRIWDRPPVAPGATVVFGDTTTNRLVGSVFSNIYRVLDTDPTNTQRAIWANWVSLGVDLPDGTYWIDWQSDGSGTSGPWAPPLTTLGQQSTGNGLVFVSGAWTYALDATAGKWQGFPFLLNRGAAAAAALKIGDSAGNSNGILEPGETVEIQPSWKANGNVAGVSGLSVGGPDYTLLDNAATYGNLTAGATTSCAAGSDCYAATADGARPAAHWDLSLEETLSAGVMQRWRLHVGASFDDVPGADPFYPFIETLLHNAVTGGCSATSYCPTNTTTRGQMSVFVLKAHEGPAYAPPSCLAGSEIFPDVPATNPFCPFIEELSRRGVVSGCGGGNFCPDNPVTRAQMPIFTLKTLEGSSYSPPACVAGSEAFDDVPATDPFCSWVEEYQRRGITAGCNATSYCPNNQVTRGQMAVFQTKTFSLLIYKP